MAAIWRMASARSAWRSFMSGLLRGHPRRCPLRGRAPSGGIIDAVCFRVRSLYTQGTWKMSHSGPAISRGREKRRKDGPRDGETGRGEGVEPGRTRWANRGGLELRDERRPEVLRKTTRTRRAMPSTNGHPNQWKERNWLPESDIARNRNWCARRES